MLNAVSFEAFSDCRTGFLNVFDDNHLPLSGVNVLLVNKTIGVNISKKTDFGGSVEFEVPLNTTYNLTIGNSSFIIFFKCEDIYSLSAPLQVCVDEEFSINTDFNGSVIAFFYSNKTGLEKTKSNGTFVFDKEGFVTYRPDNGTFRTNLITIVKDCYKEKVVLIDAKKLAYVGDVVWVKVIDTSTGFALSNVEVNVTNSKDRFSITTKDGVAYYTPEREGVYIYSTRYKAKDIVCTVVLPESNETDVKGFVRFNLDECFFNTCLEVKGTSSINMNSFELDVESLNTKITSSELDVNLSLLLFPFGLPLLILFTLLFEERNVNVKLMGEPRRERIIAIRITKDGKPWNGKISVVRNNVWFSTLDVIKGKAVLKLGEKGTYKIKIGSSVVYRFRVR